ncbi:MAG: type II toxin-antitoxin system HicA family toxin [Thaumarchaeota archaeon]|jgi:predicted RNA binding protein YcfA (HicA-like mRNA interferase family)|nr:type II toxin-antitoxin system HicA family toxin [Nitrososphaerota archaeon]
MSRLKVLSGKDVVKILSRFGFIPVSQKGSHVKLRRTLPSGTIQSLTIPLHEELDKGTLKAIYRQALRFIPEEELKPYFYD